MNELTNSEKALCYYKAALSHVAPRYVPARVRLPARVRGDDPFCGTFADAGEHDCECNRWGAVAVRASNGKLLGVKPGEFDVVDWRLNERAAASQLQGA